MEASEAKARLEEIAAKLRDALRKVIGETGVAELEGKISGVARPERQAHALNRKSRRKAVSLARRGK